MCFELISITSNIPPNTPHVQIGVLNTFRYNNIQAQFVITTAALKCSGTVCCYQKHLLLCAGMLVIARQNDKYRQILHCRFNYDIFKHYLLSRNNLMFLNFSYVLCDTVLLCNWHTTFRNTILTSYSTVDHIKNISLYEVLFAIILRKVDNILPDATALHQLGRDTECICLLPELNWQS